MSGVSERPSGCEPTGQQPEEDEKNERGGAQVQPSAERARFDFVAPGRAGAARQARGCSRPGSAPAGEDRPATRAKRERLRGPRDGGSGGAQPPQKA